MTTIRKSTLVYSFLFLALANLYLMHQAQSDHLQFAGELDRYTATTSFFTGLSNNLKDAQVLLYVAYPIFLLLKLMLIACIIDTGFALQQKEIPYKIIFCAVLLAEYTYLFPNLINLIWRPDWWANPYLPYLHYSFLEFFSIANFPFFLKYLANAYSLFEWLYTLLLVFLLAKLSGYSLRKTGSEVLKSYGLGYLLWSLGLGLYLSTI